MANPNPGDISSRITLIAGIAPTNQVSQYATHFAEFGSGGLRRVDVIENPVGSQTCRNTITSARRQLGMLVFVEADGLYYQLITNPTGETTTNTDWQVFNSGGGSSSSGRLEVTVSNTSGGTLDANRAFVIDSYNESTNTVSVTSTTIAAAQGGLVWLETAITNGSSGTGILRGIVQIANLTTTVRDSELTIDTSGALAAATASGNVIVGIIVRAGATDQDVSWDGISLYKFVVPGTSGTGEDNTASNAVAPITGQAGLVNAKSGVDLPFKILTPGSDIVLTQQANDVVIATTAEANTNSNAAAPGTNEAGLVNTKVLVDTPIKVIKGGANVTITSDTTSVTIESTDTGEANTNSDAGDATDGLGLVNPKVDVDTPIKRLKEGTNITLTSETNDIVINTTAEINTNSNAVTPATGQAGLVNTKVGPDTPIKILTPGNLIALQENTNNVVVNTTAEINTNSNAEAVGANEAGLVNTKSNSDTPIKTIKGSTHVTVTSDATSVTISSVNTGGTVTNVSGTGPVNVANPTTTPVISVDNARAGSTPSEGLLGISDKIKIDALPQEWTLATDISVNLEEGDQRAFNEKLYINITGDSAGNGTAGQNQTPANDTTNWIEVGQNSRDVPNAPARQSSAVRYDLQTGVSEIPGAFAVATVTFNSLGTSNNAFIDINDGLAIEDLIVNSGEDTVTTLRLYGGGNGISQVDTIRLMIANSATAPGTATTETEIAAGLVSIYNSIPAVGSQALTVGTFRINRNYEATSNGANLLFSRLEGGLIGQTWQILQSSLWTTNPTIANFAGTDATGGTDNSWVLASTGSVESVTVNTLTSPVVATTTGTDVVLSTPELPIVFDNNRSYAPDAEVFSLGRLYRSRNFITAPTSPAVLDNPSSDLFNWQGIEAIAQWDVTRGNGQPNPYGTDDQVWFNEKIYIYTGDGTSNRNPGVTPTDWSLPASTASVAGVVSITPASTSIISTDTNTGTVTVSTPAVPLLFDPRFGYAPGDEVFFGRKLYVARMAITTPGTSDPNLPNPGTDAAATSWSEVTNIPLWNITVPYTIGDQVVLDEKLYIALIASTGVSPTLAGQSSWAVPSTGAGSGDTVIPDYINEAPTNPDATDRSYVLQRRSDVSGQSSIILTFPPNSTPINGNNINDILQLSSLINGPLGNVLISGNRTVNVEANYARTDSPDVPVTDTTSIAAPGNALVGFPVAGLPGRIFVNNSTQSGFVNDLVGALNVIFTRNSSSTSRAVRLEDTGSSAAPTQRIKFYSTDPTINFQIVSNFPDQITGVFAPVRLADDLGSRADRTDWLPIGDTANIDNIGTRVNNGEDILVPGIALSAKRIRGGNGVTVITETSSVNNTEDILVESSSQLEYRIINNSGVELPAESIINFNDNDFNRTTGVFTIPANPDNVVLGQSHALFIEERIGIAEANASTPIITITAPGTITPDNGAVRVHVINDVHPSPGLVIAIGIPIVSTPLAFGDAIVASLNANREFNEMYLATNTANGANSDLTFTAVQPGLRLNGSIRVVNIDNALPFDFNEPGGTPRRDVTVQATGGDVNIGMGVLYGIIQTTRVAGTTEDRPFAVIKDSANFYGLPHYGTSASPITNEFILGEQLNKTGDTIKYTFDGLSTASIRSTTAADFGAPIVITPPIETGQEIVAVETPNSIRFNFSSPPAGFIQNRIDFGTLSGIASFNGEGGVSYAFLNGPNGDTDPTNFGPTFSRVINTGSGADFVNAIFTDANPINDYTLTSSIDTFRTVFTNTPGFANWTNNGNGNFTVSFRDDVDVNAISVQGPQLTIVARNTGGVTTWRNTANVDQTGIFATNGTTAVIPKHSFVFVTPAFASNGVHNITGVVSTSEPNLYQDVYVTTEDIPVSSTEPVFIVSSGIIRDFELPTTGNTATANTSNLLRYIDIRKYWTQDNAEGNGSGFGGNGDGRVPPSNPATAQVIARSGSTSNLWTIKKYDSTKIGGIVNQPDLARIFTVENRISGVGPAGTTLTYEGNSGIQSTLGSPLVNAAGGIELQQPFGDVFIKRNWAFFDDGSGTDNPGVTGGFVRTTNSDFSAQIYPPLHLESTGLPGDTRGGYDTHDTRFWTNTTRFGAIGYYQPIDLSPADRNTSIGVSAFMDVIFNIQYTDTGNDPTQGDVFIVFDHLYHRGTAGFQNHILANGSVNRGHTPFSVNSIGPNYRVRLNTGYPLSSGDGPNFPGYYGGFNVENRTNPNNTFGQTIHIHDPTNFGFRWVYSWNNPGGTPPIITAVPVGEYYGNTTTVSDFRIPYAACASLKRLW